MFPTLRYWLNNNVYPYNRIYPPAGNDDEDLCFGMKMNYVSDSFAHEKGYKRR